MAKKTAKTKKATKKTAKPAKTRMVKQEKSGSKIIGKAQLVELLRKEDWIHSKKDACKAAEFFLNLIPSLLKKEKSFALRGVGTFKAVSRKVLTPSMSKKRTRKVITFKPSKVFKTFINPRRK